MSIDLVKAKAATLGIVLEKKGVTKVPPLRVCADYDVSGSMRELYRSGVVQKVADQLLGVAFKFDDNGEIDTFVFDSSTTYIGTSGANDYGTFVNSKVLDGNEHNLWGSTNYYAAFEANMEFLYKETPAVPAKKGFLGIGGTPAVPGIPKNTSPALVLFFTDGSPDSIHVGGEAIIKASQGENVYWQLVGIGNSDFRFIKMLADKYPNCGFIDMKNPSLSDEEMYTQLMSDEFVQWLGKLPSSQQRAA